MNIRILDREEVIQLWSILSWHFDKVIQHGQGESTLTDYLAKILTYNAQCWGLFDDKHLVGAGLTQFLQYAQHKTLHIIAFSGENFEQQSQVFPTVEAFAKQQGCKAIEQWGRPGWAKTLPKYVPGFKQAYVVMRKDIE